MVSDLATGAIISGFFTALGALGTSYIALQKSEMEQEQQDKRLVAQEFASMEAKKFIELSNQLNKTHRQYDLGVRDAAHYDLSQEKFEKEIIEKRIDFEQVMDETSLFLSEPGEAHLTRYYSHLIDAENYMRRKARSREKLDEMRTGDLQDLLDSDDATLEHARWLRDYHMAKRALRDFSAKRMQLLSPIGGD